MCYRGHKGAMGWRGGSFDEFPQWKIDIIMFRNTQYDIDRTTILGLKKMSFEDVDIILEEKYKNLDKALGEL